MFSVEVWNEEALQTTDEDIFLGGGGSRLHNIPNLYIFTGYCKVPGFYHESIGVFLLILN